MLNCVFLVAGPPFQAQRNIGKPLDVKTKEIAIYNPTPVEDMCEWADILAVDLEMSEMPLARKAWAHFGDSLKTRMAKAAAHREKLLKARKDRRKNSRTNPKTVKRDQEFPYGCDENANLVTKLSCVRW